MTTIVTVHHHLTFGRAGFESSQQTRMNLARMNGFDYVHLITSPQLIGYEECFRSIGFDYGSIYALDEVFMGVNATKIDKWHYQYVYDGSLVGEARYDMNCTVSPVPMWIYTKDNLVFTEESLVVWYLSEHIKDAVIFRDESRIPMPKLVRFTKMLNKNKRRSTRLSASFGLMDHSALLLRYFDPHIHNEYDIENKGFCVFCYYFDPSRQHSAECDDLKA